MPDGSLQLTSPEGFEPMGANQRLYRDVLGQFTTGVTVVTASAGNDAVGMTANSFSSVSMSPPLVMWCPAKSSSRFSFFAEAGHFAIHVLASHQQELAIAFSKSAYAFEGLQTRTNRHGVPVFSECLARFECSTYAIHDAGDHVIVVGLVEEAARQDGEPLVFSQGCFRAFDKQA